MFFEMEDYRLVFPHIVRMMFFWLKYSLQLLQKRQKGNGIVFFWYSFKKKKKKHYFEESLEAPYNNFGLETTSAGGVKSGQWTLLSLLLYCVYCELT